MTDPPGGDRNARDAPSPFALKLRKHVRGRRLSGATQLGCDRLLDLAFGTGDATHHILVELYASGNVALTDGSFTVLTLLRSHKDAGTGAAVQANRPYPLAALVRPRARLEEASVVAALTTIVDASTPPPTVKAALSRAMPHGPAVAEYVALAAGLDPGAEASTVAADSAAVSRIVAAAADVEAWIDACESGTVPPAFLTVEADKPKKKKKDEGMVVAPTHTPPAILDPATTPDLIYDTFEAFPLAQLAGRARVPSPSLDAAADTYFSAIGGQRAAAARASHEAAAHARVDRIKADQDARAAELSAAANAAGAAAAAVEAAPADADAVVDAINSVLARGTPWRDVARLIAGEAAAGNPVAGRVVGLALERNVVTVRLPRVDDDGGGGDDDASTTPTPTVAVDLDLSLRATANARALYASRRAALAKLERTRAGHAAALAAAAAKTETTLASAAARDAARDAARAFKPLWFQKFDWFVTSEGFLCLAGRDAGQNELLVRTHLTRGDAYVHADLHGAATVVLKNARGPSVPLPALSLAQAGDAAVCRSAAWSAKVAARAWWVGADQVSRSAPTGEYLPSGSFMVRGKKNYLPPSRLELGLTFLFRLDDECVAAHAGERAVRGEEAGGVAAGTDAGDTDAGSSSDGGGAEAAADGGDASDATTTTTSRSTASTSDAALLDAALAAPDPLARVAAGVAGLAVEGEEGEEVGADAAPPPSRPSSTTTRRKPSAAERRAMKKHGVTDVAHLPPDALAKKEEVEKPAAPPPPKQATSQPPPPPPTRGKKAKQKKLRDRYGNQDEEERALATAALAAAGAARGRRERRDTRKAVRAAARTVDVAGPTQEEMEAVGAVGRVERKRGGGDGPVAAPDANPPPPPTTDPPPSDDDETIAAASNSDAALLATLTCTPLPTDTLLQAIPMAAPLSALSTAPTPLLRVKLTPGTGKRGRVAKTAVELMLATNPTLPPHLRQLMRAVPDADLAAVVPGGAKVSAPGVAKLAAKARRVKKEGKKGG